MAMWQGITVPRVYDCCKERVAVEGLKGVFVEGRLTGLASDSCGKINKEEINELFYVSGLLIGLGLLCIGA